MSFFNTMDIGIDLGTANILVFVKDKGVVINEPAVVAFDLDENKIMAIGAEAKDMLGRTPGNIVAVRPLREGVIADYEATEAMLKYFIKKVAGSKVFFKPRVMVCVPIGITSVEKRAVIDATLQAGASKVYLIEEPLAGALGAGIDFSRPGGHIIVDIGGGTTDVAVLSIGGIVTSASIRVGGDSFDEAIVRYLKKDKNIMVGEQTAEDIKKNIASVYDSGNYREFEINGRDMITGMPHTMVITTVDIREALMEPVQAIVDCVRGVLESVPPELAADIIRHGIVMTGGGSLLPGLDQFIAANTKIKTMVADNPLDCVALGTGMALNNLNKLKDCVTSMEDAKR